MVMYDNLKNSVLSVTAIVVHTRLKPVIIASATIINFVLGYSTPGKMHCCFELFFGISRDLL